MYFTHNYKKRAVGTADNTGSTAAAAAAAGADCADDELLG